MDVFDLDQSLIRDYERFARSFTHIRSADIRLQVEDLYASRRFWPEPLVSVNPHFEPGLTVDDLVLDRVLHSNTARVFCAQGKAMVVEGSISSSSMSCIHIVVAKVPMSPCSCDA